MRGKSRTKTVKMSRRIADNICNDPKQPKLAAFITNKASDTTSGIRKNRQILMNMLVNVNLKSRIGKKDAKTICFVTAIPSGTSSITSEANSSTSATVCANDGTIDSTTVNLNVTLNVTTDAEAAGK